MSKLVAEGYNEIKQSCRYPQISEFGWYRGLSKEIRPCLAKAGWGFFYDDVQLLIKVILLGGDYMKILEPFDGTYLPKVETDRLILRQRTMNDVEDMFAYASLPQVCYPAGFPPIKTVEEEKEYFENKYLANLKEKKLPSGYGITIKGSDRIIGSCDFNNRHEDDVYEIGYLLHPDFWGQGYVPEAVAALIEVAFTILNLHKVEICCYDYNKQSQRVAEKLGFTLEAKVRDRKDVQDRRCAELRYGLLRSEWEVSK